MKTDFWLAIAIDGWKGFPKDVHEKAEDCVTKNIDVYVFDFEEKLVVHGQGCQIV